MPYRDNTDEAGNAADDHWTEFGDDPAYDPVEDQMPTHIEIFGANGCSYCTKAVALCKQRQMPYKYLNIDEDEEAFDQLVGRIKSWKTVPQIFIGARHIGGFDDLQKELG